MANRNKAKGDRFERDVAAALNLLLPGLGFRRKLGAGRSDDTGDIECVDSRLVIQAKYRQNVKDAVRSSADGALEQADNADAVWALGVANILGARGQVRMLACCYEWPGDVETYEPIPTFGTTIRAVSYLTSGADQSGLALEDRIAQIVRASDETLYVASLAAWAAAWAGSRTVPIGESRDSLGRPVPALAG